MRKWSVSFLWGMAFLLIMTSPVLANGDPTQLATGTPSFYQVTVTKVEMDNGGGNWTEIFSGTATLDLTTPDTFPGISDLNLPAGTYSRVRITFLNRFVVEGRISYSQTSYYTTADNIAGGTANQASKATAVEGDMAQYTFLNQAWGALDTPVTPNPFNITPITVDPTTDYQPTLTFDIRNTLLLMGVAGNAGSYYFALGPPTNVTLVPPS